jgi:hypothetical protein
MDPVTRHTPIAANTMRQDPERGMWVSVFDYEALEMKYAELEERLAKRGELVYEGSFPLAFLRVGEAVRASSDGAGGCEIVDGRVGSVFRILLGQTVVRKDDGSLAVKDGGS